MLESYVIQSFHEKNVNKQNEVAFIYIHWQKVTLN